MASITYTAKRRLMSGHVAGTDYSFDADLEAADARYQSHRSRSQSLGGNVETNFHRLDAFRMVTTPPILRTSTEAAQFREFLSSAIDGHAIEIDLDGTVASPVDPVAYELTSDSFQEDPVEGALFVRFAFEVREL